MKWTTWILFALAVMLVTGVLAMVSRQSQATPEDFFVAVQKRMAAGRYDPEEAVQNLGQVLESAQAAGDSELAARVLLLRGQTLRDLGAFDRAKTDLLAVAAQRPADPSVEDELIELEQKAGDFHAALARAQRLVDGDPKQSHPRVLVGRLHRLAGEKALARATEILSLTLVPDASAKAGALLEQSAALDPKDLRRIAIAHEMRDLLRGADTDQVEEVLDLDDAACAELDAARSAWIDSLEHGAEPEAITGLVDLFVSAGQTARAVDLAMVTARLPVMRSDARFARTLMLALADLGRLRYAGYIAAQWGTRPTPPPGDFLLDCCDILWRSRSTEALQRAANALIGIGTQPQISAAYLYIGLYLSETTPAITDATAARTNWQRSATYLQKFALGTDADPFPGARAEAWKRVARAMREIGDSINERSALIAWLALAPTEDGEAWLRLAKLELDAPNVPYREADLHFARGMALLPKRTAELLPRWNQIGNDELRSSGIDMESVRTNLQQGRGWNAPNDAPPFVRYSLADAYLAVHDGQRAATQVRAILEQAPGFVPALDLSIRIADVQGRKRDRMDAVIERVQRAGPTAKTDTILRETRTADLEPRDLLGLMRADPERTGRIALAEGMARHGRPGQALNLLATLGSEALGDSGRLLQARLLLLQRDPKKAFTLLSAMELDDLIPEDGVELYARAALDADETAGLGALGATLARRVVRGGDDANAQSGASDAPGPAFDRNRARVVADMLLATGHADAAQPILAALDSTRRLRGPDVLLRLAASGVQRGAVDEARSVLERAHAFDMKGATEFEALLVAAGADKNADLSALAHDVETTPYPHSPFAHTQVLLLQGKTKDARALIDERLAGEMGSDPWWNLTAAAAALQSPHAGPPALSTWLGDDAGREAQMFLTGGDAAMSAQGPDPRRALAFVWAAHDPRGIPFARAWLEHVDPAKQGDLWPEWIRASIDAGQELNAQALARLKRLIARHPGFGPAWELEAEILERGELSDADRVKFAEQRSAALGSTDGTPAERLVVQARAQTAAGRFDEASTSARAALESDAWSLDARGLMAQLQTRAGKDQLAFGTLQSGLALASPDDGRAWPPPPSDASYARFVGDYLAAMERLIGTPGGALTRTRAEAFLKTLAKQRPDDPRVALAQARVDLDADERNPSMGVMRAYSRLDAFRAAHKDVPLDDLAEGSVAAWAQFYERLDPPKALSFLEDELGMDPTRLSTWVESAHAAEANGDVAEALKRLELCARLAPRGDVLREILRLRSLGDMAPEEIEKAAKEIVEVEGRTAADAELVLLEARCYLNLGPRNLQRAMELLKGLEGMTGVSREVHVQAAVLSATAWMTRGTPDDVRATQAVLGDVRDEGDAYQRGYVRALWGLAHAL